MSFNDLLPTCFGATEPRGLPPNQPPRRKVLCFAERRRPADKALEDLLSSAMLASDVELRRILMEVDSIAKTLKAGTPDAEALKIAQHPAIWSAMKHALIDRELRHLALTDDLTCLYNRRGFFAAAAQLLKLARRKNQSLLLFYCDLDNLKVINDSCGNGDGDLALIRAADALEQTFRDSDLLARIGGDEFAVLSMEATSLSQGSIQQRLKKNLKKCSAEEGRYTLSLSVGAARFDPKAPVSLGELMMEADRLMCEQKSRRLNPPSGKLQAGAFSTGVAMVNLAKEP